MRPSGCRAWGSGCWEVDAATGASPSLPWYQVTLEKGPGLPLRSCVTLGQLLTLSEGQCLIHKTGQVPPTEIMFERPVCVRLPLSSMICAHGDCY